MRFGERAPFVTITKFSRNKGNKLISLMLLLETVCEFDFVSKIIDICADFREWCPENKKMRQCGEFLQSNSIEEGKTTAIYRELRIEGSAEKKITLPNIQPTVVQTLPSCQQTLPSLWPTEKLSLPTIPPKVKNAPTRPKSSVKRMLPSNPTAENVALSCIKANLATSVHQLLPTLPSIGKRDASSFEKPQTKVKSTVKRLLPNIPMPEKLSLPSIEPIVVKAQLKGCSRRQRFLPSVSVLPTIKGQLSPVLEEMEATTEGVHTAESEQTKGVHPVEIAKSKVHIPAEGNMLQSREMKQKDNSLFDPNEEVEVPKAALESAGEERPPNQNDYLPENYRTKRIETKQKPKKIKKGNQKCLEEQMFPSLKPTDKTFLENPKTALEHHPGFLIARKTAIIRPRDKAHLAFFHPTKELPHRIPKLPLKKPLPSFRQTLDEFPSRQPSIEKDSSGFTGNQQILRTEGLRRLQHTMGYIGTLVAREMKSSLLGISGEQPQTKDQETAGAPRKTTFKSFSPQNVLVENKFSRTSAYKGTEISVGQGEALSRLQLPLENIPSKPLQKQARRSQIATETGLIPNVKPRQKETPLSFQPKPGGYAFRNIKRGEFEQLHRLRLVAKRNWEKEGESGGILTVKPALPGIQSDKENVTKARPHLSQPTIEKGPTSAQPSAKRQQSKWRTKAWRNPPSLQPTVKQVLPSSSNYELW